MRILVVDDDPEMVHVVRVSLESRGHDVSVAGSGAEAIETVDATEPEAVLLDVMLPDMDGTEVLERLRRRRPGLPVVFLTGKNRPEEISRLEGKGANGVIAKPFDPLELPDAVERKLT